MGKTSYFHDWETKYGRLTGCKIDQFSAFCKICKKAFSVSGRSISQAKHHSEGQKYKDFLKSVKRLQNTIVASSDGMRLSQKTKWALTSSEKVLKAEILEALHVAQYDIFSSAAEHVRLFQLKFPDSAIAASYNQSCLTSRV